MAVMSLSTTTTTTLVLAFISIVFLVMGRFRARDGAEKPIGPASIRPPSEAAQRLVDQLSSALPDIVLLSSDGEVFEQSMNAYWAKQECEVVPCCVLRPTTTEQLSTAIKLLSREYRQRQRNGSGDDNEGIQSGLFAIRSGGHSPVSHAASIEDGVLIDMRRFSDVVPAEDGSDVTIGVGAKWGKVYQALDAKQLAVAGGRNSAVGVGGLILGGGISFFSQRFGLVCSNIISYEIVLASGSIETASGTLNPDLWRALKGGGNNYGIVTRITVSAFPSANIWSGFLYMPSMQAAKVLSAFHDFVDRANPNDPSTGYDNHASGPIACFTYLQKSGIQAIAVNLVYTKSSENPRKWPECWKSSAFKSLWRLWSTCKVRSLADACDEMNALNPPGRRQSFGTTTIKNDPATIQAAHNAYKSTIASIKRKRIADMSWTLVLQPILPDWVHKGDDNPLGLNDIDKPLILIIFTVNWTSKEDDELVQKLTREAIEEIDAFADTHGTAHRYRYMNYCGSWQNPFDGYGEENTKFLQDTSNKYDPDGLFQRGCVGGFKLGLWHESVAR